MSLLKLFKRPPAEAVATRRGYLDAVSERHVAGWVWNPADANERVSLEAVLATTNEILVRGLAGGFVPGLRKFGIGDGMHGFNMRFPRNLTMDEQTALIVRPIAGITPLERAITLATTYQPVRYIVSDLVDNCNLRCPFCVYDYANTHTTHTMTDETFDAAIRFAPHVTDGNFWLSCLHEPTLHPRLEAFIEKVPKSYRPKFFYTSNLAKRMPPSYFMFLANSGMHHINISIESLHPPTYEKMRKGARFSIFKENWDNLVEAFGQGTAPPKLRYIALAYKSTVRDLPALVEYLLQHRRGSIVEVRHTYDVPHIPRGFRQQEYLGRTEWLWLRDQLAHYTAEQVLLVLPPGVDDPAFDDESAASSEHVASSYEATGPAPSAVDAMSPDPFRAPLPNGFLAGQYGFRLLWDGRLEVNAVWGNQDQPAPPELRLATTNVRAIRDVEAFLDSLP